MRILVSKIGSSYRSRSSGSNMSGEQGETEGLLRHLVAQGHDVTYFGRVMNGSSVPEGCKLIEPYLQNIDGSGMGEETTHADQYNGWGIDEVNLSEAGFEEGSAPLWIQVAGYAGCMSFVDNPKGVTVQACGIRYTAPILNASRFLKAKRVIVNNDPRTYPRDQEMTLLDQSLLPYGLLDQQINVYDYGDTSEVITRVGGIKLCRRHRYAKCESWGYLELVKNTGEFPCIIVAHAHIADGCRNKGRDQAWRDVLDGCNENIRVFGRGWEHYSKYDPKVFLGPIEGGDVVPMFARSICSPCVAAEPGFYTGKPYVMMAAGCIPLMYGNGQNPYTWDPRFQLVSIDNPTRVNKPGDLARAIDYACSRREMLVNEFEASLKPDFDVLDRMISDFGNVSDNEFWDLYGGWRVAR